MNFRDLLNIFEQNAPSQTISGRVVTQPQAAAAASAAPPPKPLPYKGSQDAQAIARASGVKNVNVIKPGQVLKMPNGAPDYEVQKGDTLDKIARRNKTAPAADPNQAAVNAANKVQTDQTAAVAAANANPAAAADKPPAPPAPPAVTPAPQTNALGVAAQANIPRSPTAIAPVVATVPPTVEPVGGTSSSVAFNQGNLGSRADPDATAAQPAAQPAAAAPADPAGGPKPASYMYQAGKANPNYETGAGQPQWVTMNDVNSKPAAPALSPAATALLRGRDFDSNAGNRQAGKGEVATGTDGTLVSSDGTPVTSGAGRNADLDALYGDNKIRTDASGRQYTRQKSPMGGPDTENRYYSKDDVKNFFGFRDKSKAAQPAATAADPTAAVNPNVGVKGNMTQNRMRESDDALSELMRLSGRTMQEKAPPGAKAERQVKHVKAGYAKDGKLTNKEKSIAYATAWKSHNKSKVSESVMLEAGSALEHIIKKFKHETKNFLAGNDLDNDLYDALYDYYSDNGEIPYGVAKARDGDPIQWVSDRFADEMQMHGYGRQTDMLNMPGHDHELTELARLAGLSESQVSECGDMDSMEQHDSMSVSTNMSSDGTKSVNISAQGDRADSLLQMLKMAGMRPYDDHEHAGMTEPEVIMISSEPQHDDMHDSMMHDEMMGEEELDEYANTSKQEYQTIDSILRQGDDLNREKAQHPVAGFTGDNPMAEEVALDEELQSLLDSILIKDGIKVGPMGGPDDISKVHVPYVEPKSKYSSSVLDAEKPYRDEKTGKMITPPRGATMPPPDSQYAPGDQRNMMPPKRK